MLVLVDSSEQHPKLQWYWQGLKIVNENNTRTRIRRYFKITHDIILVKNSTSHWHSTLYWYQTTFLNDTTNYTDNERYFKKTSKIFTLEGT
jgi:hypothetical protein